MVMTRADSLQIGVLVPNGNVVHEREFDRLRPAGVGFAFRGFAYPPAGSPKFCDDLASQMAPSIRELREWGAGLILVGCTTASMNCDDAVHHARLEAMAGVPVVTAARASREAIEALKLNALGVATPYGTANNRVVQNYLQSHGIAVTAIRGLDLDRSPEVWKASAANLTPQQLLEVAASVDSPESGGVYFPCTGIGSLEAIIAFEAATGKPAFSSIQAGFWASLRRLGYPGRRSGCGRLIDRWDF